MAIPDISTELRQSLDRHRFSLRPQPEARSGEKTVHLVLDHGAEALHAGRVDFHLGLWSAFAVVRGHGLFRSEEVSRHETFEEAVLAVLANFTHLE
ncbi:hypothetical protein [Saccharopolyspora gloriosae]|uniref:hypothetical protein n=1 Tax=Saccharopolyspora gloriosae TaxID=455344 RepID=UPI001FB5F477|nr:hypothetical protein [Saccharopolyspora gloriosae]